MQVFLTLEPRIFKFHDESIFRYHNGKKFSKYNREFDVFKDRLFEFDISFIPRYRIAYCDFTCNFVSSPIHLPAGYMTFLSVKLVR